MPYLIVLFVFIFFFDGVVVGIWGFLLIVIASSRWGLYGGLATAIISSLFLSLLVFVSSYEIILYRILAAIGLNFVLGISIGQGVDLLLKKRIEVSATNKKYKDLVEQSSDWIWEIDDKHTYSFVNTKVEELLGYLPEEMIGKTPFDFMSSSKRRDLKKELQKNHFLIKTEFIHRDGHPVLFETRGVPVLDDAGSIVGCRGIGRDISHRKEMEKALKKSEAKYRNLYETMAQGVLYQTKEGKILSANPAAQHILGLKKGFLVGCQLASPCWNFSDEDGRPLSYHELPSMVAIERREEIHSSALGLFHPIKKENIWIQVTSVPQFKEGADQPHQVYSIFEDITKRKKAEEKAEESIREIEIQNMELESLYDYLHHFTSF